MLAVAGDGTRAAATAWAKSRISSGEPTEKCPGNMGGPTDFVGRSRSPQDRNTRKKVGHVKYLGIKLVE
jgi:hypothetical protein